MRWASRSTPGLVAVADDVAAGELVPRPGADQQAEVVVAGRPRVAQQLGPAALEHLDRPSRGARRGRAAAGPATPGSSPRARRCGSRSRPSSAARRGRTTRRWCARAPRWWGATRRAGRPAAARRTPYAGSATASARATTSSAPSWWWPNVSPSVAATTSPPISSGGVDDAAGSTAPRRRGRGRGRRRRRRGRRCGRRRRGRASGRGRCAAASSASIWPGARIVKRMPSSASTRSTKSFTAVSGQPHALGAAAEAVGEVEDPPPHVRADVALVAEREDGVAVGLGDGAAGHAVGVDDAARTRRGGAPRATTAAWARR